MAGPLASAVLLKSLPQLENEHGVLAAEDVAGLVGEGPEFLNLITLALSRDG
jgi:hypothetical protein